jgi:hypothetical protein
MVVVDTDQGIGEVAAWIRKVLRAGHYLAYMDPLDEDVGREGARGVMRLDKLSELISSIN